MHDVEWKRISGQFVFEGSFDDVEHNTTGHINDTYIVTFDTRNGSNRRYVVQRINQNVFLQPKKVMENIQAVTEYLRKKIILAGGNPDRETINLVPTTDGRTWHQTDDGHFWRAYHFIEGAKTYETVDDPEHFRNAGKAFGHFQSLLSDFPAEKLHETIPQFHDTAKRFNDFITTVERDPSNRAIEVKEEIEFVKKRVSDASKVIDMLKEERLPLRVIHNDTKLNNVLIDDETGEGICVLDLDTVMPGSALFDFGDAIRFGASTALEDERDLSKVFVDLDLFEQFTRGYLSSAHHFLTKTELEYLAFSAKLMTYECGMRFLADHIDGDIYFKTSRPGHNLDRARTQFKLVEDMERKMDKMQAIVVGARVLA